MWKSMYSADPFENELSHNTCTFWCVQSTLYMIVHYVGDRFTDFKLTDILKVKSTIQPIWAKKGLQTMIERFINDVRHTLWNERKVCVPSRIQTRVSPHTCTSWAWYPLHYHGTGHKWYVANYGVVDITPNYSIIQGVTVSNHAGFFFYIQIRVSKAICKLFQFMRYFIFVCWLAHRLWIGRFF